MSDDDRDIPYEYELVYFGSVKEKTDQGWQPAPGLNPVQRVLTAGSGHVLTYVWMRRAVT